MQAVLRLAVEASPIQADLKAPLPRANRSQGGNRSSSNQGAGHKTTVKGRMPHEHVAEDPFSQMVAQFCFASGIAELQAQGDVWYVIGFDSYAYALWSQQSS
jgi:hypothetical protein